MKMENVIIRSASSRVRTRRIISDDRTNLVIPGDEITGEKGYTSGHGVYVQDDKIVASLPGSLQQVNRLITVKPLKARYIANTSDVIVGRVLEVGQKRWKVDIKTSVDATLNLSSVNLPTGEQRIKCDEDEKWMREYLSEGDVICAEVVGVNSVGAVNIQIRSSFHGKLGQGTLVSVSPSLIKKRKSHIHSLSFGANIILGNNGYIWIAPASADKADGFEQNLEPVPRAELEVVARLRNCILALAERWMMLFDTSIVYAYEASAGYQAKELLLPEVKQEIVNLTQQRLMNEWTDK